MPDMRLRFVPEAQGIVEKSPYVIHDELPLKKPVSSLYKRNNPIHVEIGTGKGGFLVEMAKQHPEINYLGVEFYESVLFRAVEKMEAFPDEERPDNILFLSRDASVLPEVFTEEKTDRIYLNFSDPWPKKRHAKRRLTSERFLAVYEKVLKAGGRLIFKTDNRGLFDFSLEEIQNRPGWRIEAVTYDLHRDPVLNEGNVMTEYERKFSALGSRINKLIAVYEPESGECAAAAGGA